MTVSVNAHLKRKLPVDDDNNHVTVAVSPALSRRWGFVTSLSVFILELCLPRAVNVGTTEAFSMKVFVNL